MYGIIETEDERISVIIPSIPGLTNEVEFDGVNFVETGYVEEDEQFRFDNPIWLSEFDYEEQDEAEGEQDEEQDEAEGEEDEEQDEAIIVVSAGNTNTLVLINNNIYGCGNNIWKQLVDTEDTTLTSFTLLDIGDLNGETIVSVKAGISFSLALTETGKIFIWGYVREILPNIDFTLLTPTLVQGLEGIRIVEIQCGITHVIAREESGDVYAFGTNDFGVLGFLGQGVFPPTKLPGGYRATQVCAIGYTSAILNEDGNVHIFGRETGPIEKQITGQKIALSREDYLLSAHDSTLTVHYLPSDITHEIEFEAPITSISGGGSFWLVVLENGLNMIKSNGSNDHGELGSYDYDIGYITSYDEYVDVELPPIEVRSISTGYNHSVLIDSLNRIFVWGSSDSGKLGIGGALYDIDAPIIVDLP